MENKNITLEAIRAIVREEMRPLNEELRQEFTKKMDTILNSNDSLAKKLDTILAELPATAHRQDELARRVGHLETQVNSTS